jgi:hypothetical protein
MDRSRTTAKVRRRGRLLGYLVAVVPLGMLGVVAAAGSAAALPSNCSQSGSTVTCSYAYTGGEQQFAVPAGVSSVHVTATGAPGAAAGYTDSGGAGGLGAVVSGDVPVTGVPTLYVEVGGPGGLYCLDGFGGNGFNGGGAGYDDAQGCVGGGLGISGGGGGASDVRTVSCGSSCNPLDPASLGSRLLVAAGGGGGGAACDSSNFAGNCVADVGGAGGNAATMGTGDSLGLISGGGPGTQTAGGATGGQYPYSFDRPLPHPSDLGLGGDGQPSFGGGGGGGYYGGGGGGSAFAGGSYAAAYAGGGGGGSNLVPSGGTAVTAATGANSGVTISYTVTASTSTVVSLAQGSLNPSVFGQPVTFTATVTNLSGPSAPTGSVQFVIDGVNSGSPVALSSTGTASLTVSSLSVGSHAVVADYVPADGFLASSGTLTPPQQVNYAFTGFAAPVDNPPAVNMVTARQSIPIQFSLGGNFGLGIIAAGYPTVQQVSCTTGVTVNTSTETDTAGGSGLQYNATTGTYTYVWKTSKASKGTCQVFTLELNDGTVHTANFQYAN